MMKRKGKKTPKTQLDRIEQAVKTLADKTERNIGTLVEDDKFIIKQYDKLYDEFEILRNDTRDVKDKTVEISLRLRNVEEDTATIKRKIGEEKERGKTFETRISKLEAKV